MLDFYSLNDNESMPEFPEENNYLGSINLTDYKLINELVMFGKNVGIEIGYHQDFRIRKDELIIMLDFAQNEILRISSDKKDSYVKIRDILRLALINKKTGLVCFCD